MICLEEIEQCVLSGGVPATVGRASDCVVQYWKNRIGLKTACREAIQGLNQKLIDELKRRDAENSELKRRLERLE